MKKERQGKNVLFLLWPEIFKSRYVLTRHVTCTVVTMHSIAESLSDSDFPKLTPSFPTTFSDRDFNFFLNRAPKNHVFERVEPANLLRNTH